MAAVAFQHTPSLVPAQLFWPASRGTEPSLHLCRPTCSRGERLAWPPASPCLAPHVRGWQRRASRGRELLLPSATLQPRSSWPRSGLGRELLKASWHRQQEHIGGLGFQVRGLSCLTAKGIHISFPVSTSLSSSSCSSFSFSAIPAPEDGAAKPARVPIQLPRLFCFF